MPTTAQIVAAEASGRPLDPRRRAAQLLYPILYAEASGKRRWCAWCFNVTPDDSLEERQKGGIRGYHTCARCSEVGYCSEECQGKHWRRGHKHRCPLLAVENAAAVAAAAAAEEERGKAAGGSAAAGAASGAAGARRGGGNKKKKKGKKRAAAAAAGGDNVPVFARVAEATTGPWPPYDDGGDLWGAAGGKVGVGKVGRVFLGKEEEGNKDAVAAVAAADSNYDDKNQPPARAAPEKVMPQDVGRELVDVRLSRQDAPVTTLRAKPAAGVGGFSFGGSASAASAAGGGFSLGGAGSTPAAEASVFRFASGGDGAAGGNVFGRTGRGGAFGAREMKEDDEEQAATIQHMPAATPDRVDQARPSSHAVFNNEGVEEQKGGGQAAAATGPGQESSPATEDGSIASWLSKIHSSFAEYVPVFEAFGCGDTSLLEMLVPVDREDLIKDLEAAGAKRGHVKFIRRSIDELMARGKAKAWAKTHHAVATRTDAIMTAATEAEILAIFHELRLRPEFVVDADLQQAAKQKKDRDQGRLWTKRVATEYGKLLRFLKEVREGQYR
eukprot:g3646.t1